MYGLTNADFRVKFLWTTECFPDIFNLKQNLNHFGNMPAFARRD